MYFLSQYCAWEESVKNTVSASKWKIDLFMNSSQCRELDRIDGEPVEFEWTIFTGFTALVEVQNMMTEI